MYFITSSFACPLVYKYDDELTHFSFRNNAPHPKSFRLVHYRNSRIFYSLNLENYVLQAYYDMHDCNIDYLCLSEQLSLAEIFDSG